MIALSLLFNKLAGFYGILALVTGYSLSFLQLSMYIYSIGALILLVYLMSHIQRGSPFEMVSLAYFYAFDTLLNCAYTACFGISWFLTLSAAAVDQTASAPGSQTINDTAGFTAPGVTNEIDGAVPAANGDPSLANAVEFSESVPSILIIVFFNVIRLYFATILFSYARQCVRAYIASKAAARSHLHMDGIVDDSEGPFAAGSPLGAGWKGQVGRAMLNVGRGWWVGGAREDEEWARTARGKFVKQTREELPGTTLREQRARSGTGPPPMRLQTQGLNMP